MIISGGIELKVSPTLALGPRGSESLDQSSSALYSLEILPTGAACLLQILSSETPSPQMLPSSGLSEPQGRVSHDEDIVASAVRVCATLDVVTYP